MMNKILAGVGMFLGAITLASQSAAAQLSTSTLGSAIDNVNGTFYDYFLVLLAKYWPFVVGVGILIVVWHFGRRALNAFS